MSSSSKKEDQRQEDIVRQERDAAANQSEDYRRSNESAIDAFLGQMNRLASDYQPEERQRFEQVVQLQPQLMEMLQNTAKGQTSQYYTPLEAQLQGRLSQDLANPLQSYEDTFQPLLTQLQDRVRSQAAQRGLVGSGLELENMGRAGIDLAIAQANQRNQARQQATSNALAGNQQIEAGGQNRRAELGNYLSNQQSLVDTSRAREKAILEQAATLPLGVRTDTNANVLNTNQAARQRTFELESQTLQQQQGARQSQNQALGQLLGAGVGLVAQPILSGVGMQATQALGLPQMPSGLPSYTTAPMNANSGEAMRSSYRYGSQRPSLYAQLQGRNW